MTAAPVTLGRRAGARLLPTHGERGYGPHLAAYGPLPRARRKDRRLLAEIEASGLTGRGGAGFPTARKLASVAAAWRTSVVANGAEGEPASAKDAVLLARNPHLVLDGLVLAARLVGAREATVAVSGTAEAAVRAVERAIAERPPADRPRLALVPDRFVAGEESAVVASVAGRAAKPTGRRPYERGILVQNVETLAHLALVARHGAGWFRAVGTDAEPGTALATVSGAVARPGVLEFELGSSLGELLDRCGGPAEPLDAVLVGGYFGRWLPADPGIELADAALRPLGAALGARVVVAKPRSACGLREVARVARYMAGESAGQCGPCVFGLAALAEEVEALAAGRGVPRGRIARLEAQIARRGACAHPDGALAFVTSGLALFADEVASHRQGRCTATMNRPVLPVR